MKYIKKSRLGAIVALSMLCMSVLFASPASAVVTTNNTLSVSPSYLHWDDSAVVAYNVSVNGGYIWWNGTATLYLIDPEGRNVSHGTSTINLGSSISKDWANWTISPRIDGSWTVWVTHTKTTGNGTYSQVVNKTTTFTVEDQGDWMNRTLQSWTSLWWLMFMVIALVLVVVVLFGRVGRDAGKK